MRASIVLVASLTLASACSPRLDTTRKPVDTGTFGQTLYTLVCKRLAFSRDLGDGDGVVDVAGDRYRELCRSGTGAPADADPAVLAMHENREGLIAALDAVFPEAFLGELQAYATSPEFLAIYDDGTLEAAIDRTVELFTMMAEDPELAPALSRLEGRAGYRPLKEAMGALHAVVSYPDLDQLALVLVDAITAGGAAKDEWERLQLALSREMIAARQAPDVTAPDRTLRLALDLLLTESDLLGTGRPMLLVRRDVRGLAEVMRDAAGNVPAPFADLDSDGIVDARDGRFTGTDGEPLLPPPPFFTPFALDTAQGRDPLGRALQAPEGLPLYAYVDLDRTVLGALVRDTPDLVEPVKGTALDLVRGMSALLGPRTPTSKTYEDGSAINFLGYDTTESPVLELLYGVLLLLGDPGIDDTLAFARTLIVDHPSEASRLIEAVMDVADLGDAFPAAALEPGSPLYDDLVRVANDILAVPGLAEDLLVALEDPAAANLAYRFVEHMGYKDQFDFDPDTQALLGDFVTPVDRAAPDSGWNRSVWQRLLHLINDSNHAVSCNKEGAVIKDPWIGITLDTFAECELLRIDNLAVFYVQSIAYLKDASGNVVYDDYGPVTKAELQFNFGAALGWFIDNLIDIDQMLQDESTIDGFRTHPTPQALNRVLFLDVDPGTPGLQSPGIIGDTMDPAVCADGDRFVDAHAGTIHAWETNGFYDQLRPIVQAFADHDAEQLFIDTLVVLHQHWPSPDSLQHQSINPAGHGYAKLSNVRSYEPMIVETIANHDLWPALVDGAPVMNAIVAPSGKPAPRVLADAARYVFAPQPGLTKRLGETTTLTEDGVLVDPLSPWYVLADAYKLKDARFAEVGAEAESWDQAVSDTIDLLLRGTELAGEWRFQNPRIRGVTAALVDFLRARVAAHVVAGDLDDWIKHELPDRAEEMLASPLVAGAADLVVALDETPGARVATEDLLAYLTSEVLDEEAFRTALVASGDLLQLLLDDFDLVPIARIAGRALDPDFGLAQASLEMLRAARHADTTDALGDLLRQTLGEVEPGVTPLAAIIESTAEVHRVNPMAEYDRPLSAEDYRSIFRAVGSFLDDERRGLRKFILVIQERQIHD